MFYRPGLRRSLPASNNFLKRSQAAIDTFSSGDFNFTFLSPHELLCRHSYQVFLKLIWLIMRLKKNQFNHPEAYSYLLTARYRQKMESVL